MHPALLARQAALQLTRSGTVVIQLLKGLWEGSCSHSRPSCLLPVALLFPLSSFSSCLVSVLQARPEAIIAGELFTVFAKQQPQLTWDSEHMEHSFRYESPDGPRKVYFPSPRSLEVRLEHFMRAGLGVSIWELGQGMNRFFDLL